MAKKKTHYVSSRKDKLGNTVVVGDTITFAPYTGCRLRVVIITKMTPWTVIGFDPKLTQEYREECRTNEFIKIKDKND